MSQNKLFSKHTMLLTASGLLINIALVFVVSRTGLPLYLDSVGTVLVAVLGGYLPGIAVGFLSNCINALFSVSSDPLTMYYAFISVLIALSAAYLSKKGAFRRLPTALGAVLVFTFIGGGLGSLLTWTLYGFSFGSGISAPLALYLADNLAFSHFAAQLTADILIDLADKAITVGLVYLLLRLLPSALLGALPFGVLHTKRSLHRPLTALPKEEEKLFRRASLRTKITLIILTATVILSAAALTISTLSYQEKMIQKYADHCENIVSIMTTVLDGDKIDGYLTSGGESEEYKAVKKQLITVKNSSPDVEYMYVYKIEEDGCHVVFDLDTAELSGEAVGTVIPFDPDFETYLPALFAGERIEPVISDNRYGHLLTVYLPIVDSAGVCAAYAACDMEVADLKIDQYSFFINILSLLFGVFILITAFTLWFCDTRIVKPIDLLVRQARQTDYSGAAPSHPASAAVKTGDEIEELYHSMCRTEDEMAGFIRELSKKKNEISAMQRSIIRTLATMVENRDENTGEHINRTAAYVRLVGEALFSAGKFPETVNEEYIEHLYESAPLHDIGKIKTPDAILNKPGKLTPEEFEIIKTHTTAGGDILRSALNGIEGKGYLAVAIDMASYHHERWDGTGYPEGRAGEDIPLCARIMALADVFDALTTKRSYKEAYSIEKAVEILKEESGTHFDPALVELFLSRLDKVREIHDGTDR